jgi:hypothetical protein
MAIKKSQKIASFFECKFCDYLTSNKYDYEKHIKTPKHLSNNLAITAMDNLLHISQKKTHTSDFVMENAANFPSGKKSSNHKKSQDHFTCDFCHKTYKDSSGLWRHKKKCKIEETELVDTSYNDSTDKDLIMLLIKENSELKNMMMEQQNMMMKVIENGTHNTTNYTNSNNKAFNLNFFLNETCKDAMNIMEFIDSINLQLSDLEKVGELGYVDGISNIIVKNLKALDITQRPVHCTDKKRETLYIKDEDKWEKDSERTKMRKVIKRIANKNARLLPKFKEEHPDCGKSFSKFSDQYNKIIVESMGGPGNNDFEKEEKIIKKVTKEIIVGKEPL